MVGELRGVDGGARVGDGCDVSVVSEVVGDGDVCDLK